MTIPHFFFCPFELLHMDIYWLINQAITLICTAFFIQIIVHKDTSTHTFEQKYILIIG